ncbi:MAG TPA: metalloregulator ArsR/SmtB family transcription factor [Actinomycetota bacterium]|nr:metalloregulator ArsR/SmtB family transcription factor [Actinomycetota bacterium]
MSVTRERAETWAAWFRCLGDPTRLLILNKLATARRAMTVGEIVDRIDVGQPTVSHHLALLVETGFVLAERDGTSSLYRVNERCLECFPSAADVVMGRGPRTTARAPWGRSPGVSRNRSPSSSKNGAR